MDSKKEHRCSINYETLPYKLHFFLFCAAKGGILPYMVIFLKEKLSLSATALAILFVTRSFVIAILKPTIGMIVDYFNKLKLVMICLTIGEMIFYYILLYIPAVDREPENPSTLINNSDFLNNEYFYGIFQSNMNSFTIIPQKEDLLKNRDCLKLNVTLKCTDNLDVNCFLLSNDVNTSFTVMVDNEIWQNSTIFSSNYNLSTNKAIYLNCSLYSLDEKIQPKTLEHNATYFSDLKVPNGRNFLEGKIRCSTWLHKMDNKPEIACTKPMKHTKSEKILIPVSLHSEPRSAYTTYQFWLCSLIWVLAGICTNAMFTLSDTACYECLQRTGQDYGRQRLWGAVGWGLISPATGFFNDFATGDSKVSDYTPGFHTFGILSIFEIMNLLRLDIVKPPRSTTFFKDFKKIFKSKEFDIFFTAVFIIGLFTSFIWYYLMVYVESIGGSRLLMGLLNTSQCFLGEIPFMFYSGWITKKLGHMQVLVTCFICFAIRFLCYYLIQNPWGFLPVEAIHGLTYGVFYTAMTAFAKVSSVPGTEATTQSILCATYEGLGVGVGSIVSGICFDNFGYKIMFLIASISSLGCAMCLYLVSMVLKTKTKTMELTPKIK